MSNSGVSYWSQTLFWTIGLDTMVLSLANDGRGLANYVPWLTSDPGSTSGLVDLLRSRLKPNVDFGYTYGPLTVVVSYAYAAVFGNDHLPQLVLLSVLKILRTLLFLRILANIAMPPFLSWIAAAGAILYCQMGSILAIPAEQLMLLMAIVGYQTDRPRLTLAALTLAIGFRPAVGLFMGLPCLLWIASNNFGKPNIFRVMLRDIAPSIAIFFSTAFTYIALTNVPSYLRTIVPLAGAKMYSAMEPGSIWTDGFKHFLGESSALKDIFINTHWINLICLISILPAIGICLSHSGDDKTRRVGLASGLIVVTALLFLYGNKEATAYVRYRPFFWLAGVSSLAIVAERCRMFSHGFAGILGTGLAVRVAAAAINVSSGLRPADSIVVSGTALSIPRNTHMELLTIHGIVGDSEVTVFEGMGDAKLLKYYDIRGASRRYWCLRNGLNTDTEVQRIRADLRHAQYIIVMLTPNPHRDTYRHAFLGHSVLVFRGSTFEVFRVGAAG